MVAVVQSVAIFLKPRARTDPTQRPLCKARAVIPPFLQIHFSLAFIRESGTFFSHFGAMKVRVKGIRQEKTTIQYAGAA